MANNTIDWLNDENKDKITLPTLFTVLYFADVLTSLFAAMVWGNFPHTNTYMVALVNSILMWILFKTIVYIIIMFVYTRLSRYSRYAENILTSITVVYGILLLNSLATTTMLMPAFDICPEFYQSIESNRITLIP